MAAPLNTLTQPTWPSTSVGYNQAYNTAFTVWQTWTISATTSGNIFIWNYWNQSTTNVTGINQHVWSQQVVQQVLTQEQLELQRALRRRQDWLMMWGRIGIETQQRELERQRKEAKEKAKKLLIENLTAEQQKMMEEKNYFIVEVEGVQYRIDTEYGRVKELNKHGKPVYSFCIHPYSQNEIPGEDLALALKLMLQCDRARFLRTANRSACSCENFEH